MSTQPFTNDVPSKRADQISAIIMSLFFIWFSWFLISSFGIKNDQPTVKVANK